MHLRECPGIQCHRPYKLQANGKNAMAIEGREIPLLPLKLLRGWVPAIVYNYASTLHTFIERLLCCHTPWGR